MVETLLLWFNRFTDDPAKVRSRLAGRPVLVYEPPTEDTVDEDDEDDDYQLRTQSGLSVPSIGGGDPMAVVIEKTKDNAFQRRITIGRTGNNDIVLDDTSVSRFHAWIEQQETQEWVLVDAGSRNGSTLGGRKIAPKAPAPLTNGLSVRIGALQLTYYSAQGFLDMLHRRATE